MSEEPHEPVSFYCSHPTEQDTAEEYNMGWLKCPYMLDDMRDGWILNLTLNNGQKVIVRAKSKAPAV